MASNQLAALNVTIGASTAGFDKAVKHIKNTLDILSKQNIRIGSVKGLAILGAGTVGAGITGISTAIKELAGGAFSELLNMFGTLGRLLNTVIIGGIGTATAGMTALATASFSAAKKADDLAMSAHRNEEIFGRMFPLINQTIESLSKTFGYTRTELSNMSADLGLLFVGMGLSNEAVAQLSASFLKLGINASRIHGMELSEFMSRLESGIAGANRSLHKMGIFINENTIWWEKLRLAGMGWIWVTEEQGDQMARTSLIMQGLARAGNQVKWIHMQFGGTLREVKGRISEMWLTFGEAVKPAWTRIIMKINEVLKMMGEWLERNKTIIRSWANYTADIILFVIDHWKELLDATGEVAKNIGRSLFGALTGVPGTVKSWLVGIGGFFMEKFQAIGEVITSSFGYAFNIVRTMLGNFRDNAVAILDNLWNNIKSGFLSAISKIVWGLSYLEKPFKTFANLIISLFEKILGSAHTIAIPIIDLMVAMGRMSKESADAFKTLPRELPRLDVEGNALAGFSDELDKVAKEAGVKAAAGINLKPIMEGAPQFPAVQIGAALDKMMALPMPNLEGFMAAMKKAGVEVEKWMDPLKKVFAQFKATKEEEEKRKKKELGEGMRNPLMPERKHTESEFIGIAEFGKRILAGGLSKDAAMINTARNTQRIAQMMEMWGPMLFDVMANAGVAMGPM